MKLSNRKFRLVDIITIPYNCAPLATVLIGIQRIVDGIIPTIQIVITAAFIDTAVNILSGKKAIGAILYPLLAVVGLIAYSWISYQLIRFVEVSLENSLRKKFRSAISEKRGKLHYKHIESSESWDLISRVSKEPEVWSKAAYIDFISLIALILQIVGVLLILIKEVWWAALLILVFSVPLFFLAAKSGKANYEANREVTKVKRKYEYLGEVLSGRDAVEERSLFGFTNEINKKWWNQYEIARKIEYKTQVKWFIKMKTGSVITACISMIIVFVLLTPVKNGVITLGMFIALVNGVFRLIQMMSWQLSFNVDQLVKNREFLRDLSNFSALEEVEGATDKPVETSEPLKSVEFRNVSFKYPGCDTYILKDMSFYIEGGKHYAFVGSNGAGKTTITKLITGLYDNYEGDVFINGKSIKTYSQAELKGLCSVVYQDFAKYQITFKDNISLGRVNGLATIENNEFIDKAIATIELKDIIEKLPNGIDTPLGKISEDGVDVSGGQWQRLAMARAIINPSSLRILDEPTAALDPISESNVYEKFEEISKGGTTFFISHRLGSTKLADEILVVEGGRIAEKGTHDELMRNKGLYAEMYESQRGWYQ